MKKIIKSSILISTIFASTSFALPGIDLKAGFGYVKLSPSGWVKYKGDTVDLKKDLHLGDSKDINAYLQVGLPVIPNIKFEYLPTKYEGSGKVSKNFKFGDFTFTVTDKAHTKIDIKQYDLSLFYNLPVPFIKPRLGLAVKYLDGYIDIRTTTKHEHVNVNAPIPMLYAGINAGIPGIPFEIDVEGKAIAYKGNSLIDVKGIGMFTLVGIPFIGKAYLGAGYRYQKLKLDDVDDLYSDVKFKGPFAEVGVEF